MTVNNITCTVADSRGSGGFAKSLAVITKLYIGIVSLSNKLDVKIVPFEDILKSWLSSPEKILYVNFPLKPVKNILYVTFIYL